ncbi:hypothetical protein LTR66_013994 [Elasticomyces elasticus]|nr:hypothetical protein LTR66_013994 [Elasticomyces elasticus]
MSSPIDSPLPEGTGNADFCSSPNTTKEGTRGTENSQNTSVLSAPKISKGRQAQSEAQKRFREREREAKKKIRAQVIELQQKIESLQQIIDNLRQIIDDLKQTIHNLEQKNESLQQKVEILQQQIGSLERRVEDLKAQKESVAEDVAHWRHTSNGLQRNMAALLQQSNPPSLRKERHVPNGRIGQSSARGLMLNPSDQSGPEAHPFPPNVFQLPTAEEPLKFAT